MLLLLGIGFVAAVITAVSPCVLPVLPVVLRDVAVALLFVVAANLLMPRLGMAIETPLARVAPVAPHWKITHVAAKRPILGAWTIKAVLRSARAAA